MSAIDEVVGLVRVEITATIGTGRFPKFMLWLFSDPEFGTLKYAQTPQSRKAIQDVIRLYQEWVNGDKPKAERWRAAINTYVATVYTTQVAYADIPADAHAYAAYATEVYATVADGVGAYAGFRLKARQAQLQKLQDLKEPEVKYAAINKFDLIGAG